MDDNTKHDIANDIEEIHEKLDELTNLMEENQRMVKNLYQRARLATVVVFIKWFFIIGITIGSFYFIQPFINTLVGVYGGFGGASQSTSGGGVGSDLLNLFKSL